MTTAFEAYDAVLALGASARHADRVAEMRARFEARTGAFRPDDAWFEARSRAFWDDAITSGGFSRVVQTEVTKDVRKWMGKFARAHRGLFVKREESGETIVVKDVWSGARFVVHAIDRATRDALAAAAAPFDGRLVASEEPAVVALLPGAVFHPADAAGPIGPVLEEARTARARDARGARRAVANGARAARERAGESGARVPGDEPVSARAEGAEGGVRTGPRTLSRAQLFLIRSTRETRRREFCCH